MTDGIQWAAIEFQWFYGPLSSNGLTPFNPIDDSVVPQSRYRARYNWGAGKVWGSNGGGGYLRKEISGVDIWAGSAWARQDGRDGSEVLVEDELTDNYAKLAAVWARDGRREAWSEKKVSCGRMVASSCSLAVGRGLSTHLQYKETSALIELNLFRAGTTSRIRVWEGVDSAEWGYETVLQRGPWSPRAASSTYAMSGLWVYKEYEWMEVPTEMLPGRAVGLDQTASPQMQGKISNLCALSGLALGTATKGIQDSQGQQQLTQNTHNTHFHNTSLITYDRGNLPSVPTQRSAVPTTIYKALIYYSGYCLLYKYYEITGSVAFERYSQLILPTCAATPDILFMFHISFLMSLAFPREPGCFQIRRSPLVMPSSRHQPVTMHRVPRFTSYVASDILGDFLNYMTGGYSLEAHNNPYSEGCGSQMHGKLWWKEVSEKTIVYRKRKKKLAKNGKIARDSGITLPSGASCGVRGIWVDARCSEVPVGTVTVRLEGLGKTSGKVGGAGRPRSTRRLSALGTNRDCVGVSSPRRRYLPHHLLGHITVPLGSSGPTTTSAMCTWCKYRHQRLDYTGEAERSDVASRSIAKFVGKRNYRPFAFEGPGNIYVVGRISDTNTTKFDQLRPGQRQDAIDLKGGHTKRMARRRREYESCERGQKMVWICKYSVDRWYYCERLFHLCLFRVGGLRAIWRCPCGTAHRKFLFFDSVGRLAAFHAVMEEVLELMGEKVERSFFPPSVETKAIYDFICAS
ncbi:hypothetical protein C8R45DRAFT_942752 [Mycena sanguinolenta]|nr:hypothetical protein C8R45DRAFT_942752 [Mycena sanguinolenta]